MDLDPNFKVNTDPNAAFKVNTDPDPGFFYKKHFTQKKYLNHSFHVSSQIAIETSI